MLRTGRVGRRDRQDQLTVRYRTGPVGGTVVLTLLAAAGGYGEISTGLDGQSTGGLIFGLTVILLFAGLAASGLGELRGLRTEKRPDGTAVLKIPRLPLGHAWWRTAAASDIEAVYLVRLSSRSRFYNFGVTLRDGTQLTSGAVAVNRRRRVQLTDTRAARIVDAIRRDLGLETTTGG